MTVAELNKAVEKGTIPSLLLLYGEETFLVARVLKRIEQRLVSPQDRDFNLTVLDGRLASATEIIDHARTLPVFASHRLVVVRDSQHLKADTLESLRSYLKDPVPETTLVFIADKIDKRRKFYQDFSKAGQLVQFKALYDNQLPSFVKDQAAELGFSMTEDALGRFCTRVGTQLQEVHGELLKLRTYLGERTLVDVKDVEAIVSDTRAESIFDLTNAVGQRKAAVALRLLKRLLDDGVAPLVVLAMLVRHFRQLWKASELLQQGTARNALPRALGINPYFLDGVVAQSRHFSDEEYRRAFNILLDADLALKSSGSHPSAILERVLMQLMSREASI